MEAYFVNKAFDKAINDYLNSKDKPEGILFNSFLTVAVRLLINIYGELDIINPYHIHDENALNINLTKYGADLNKINNLKNMFNSFYEIEEQNKNNQVHEDNRYFVDIQKEIIDLFFLKKINYEVMEDEQKEFFDLLYTPGTSNVLRQSINYKYAKDIYEVAKYYNEKNSIKKESELVKKNLLGFNVYREFNVGINELSKMNSSQIEELNKQIYQAFDINENAINKDYLLKEKIQNIYKKRELITTGNGYVDILLVMSVIITTIMIIVIILVF